MTDTSKILVLGSINIDLVLRTERVPVAGESFLGKDFSWVPGGKGANQAVAAARAGGDITFFGKAGNDENGRLLRQGLAEEGIDISLFSFDPSTPTGMAAILVEESGENRIIVYPGANLNLRADDVGTIIRAGGYDALLLSFEIPVTVIEAALRAAGQAGLPAYIDAGPARPIDKNTLRDAAVLSPNRSELAALTGRSCGSMAEIEAAGRGLYSELHPEHLVVKLGSEGALLISREGAEHFPAFRIEAADTTAAGDAFTAGLAVEHLRTGDIHHAVRYGSAAGALTATKLGAQPSLPARAETEEFLINRK